MKALNSKFLDSKNDNLLRSMSLKIGKRYILYLNIRGSEKIRILFMKA